MTSLEIRSRRMGADRAARLVARLLALTAALLTSAPALGAVPRHSVWIELCTGAGAVKRLAPDPAAPEDRGSGVCHVACTLPRKRAVA